MILDVIMEINVSFTTCFSISFLLSILPTKMAANPKRTVKIIANTVVNTLARFALTEQLNPRTIISDSITGNTIKHI